MSQDEIDIADGHLIAQEIGFVLQNGVEDLCVHLVFVLDEIELLLRSAGHVAKDVPLERFNNWSCLFAEELHPLIDLGLFNFCRTKERLVI